MRWLVARISFPPTPGSLEGCLFGLGSALLSLVGGSLEGCLFGLGSALLSLVGGSAGTQFSCGTHREKVAVLVEGYLAV